MAVHLYLDVHVPQAIADQLRRRGVDVVTAVEDGSATLEDHQLLDRAVTQGRVLFTQDIHFRVLAETWQRQSRPFGGLIFGHQLGATIGKHVSDLELIAQASDAEEWQNQVGYLPL